MIVVLENGYVGFVFGLGMVVIIVIIMLFLKGDYVILIDDVYGGIYCVIMKVLNCFGIEYIFVDIINLEEVEEVICLNMKVIYVEILMNLLLKIIDIKKIFIFVKEKDLLIIIDNIFMMLYW